MAQAAAAVNNKKNKKGAIQLVFSELDDLFLNTKGKAMRNLRKKVDKYVDLEKQVRTGKHQANAQQKEQIASIPELKEEIVELEALCKLYMESNPGFDKKAAPSLSEEDVRRALMNALSTFGQACGLKQLIDEDSSFVECSAAEGSSLASVLRSVSQMQASAAKGSATFGKDRAINDFADTFTKLALGTSDVVTDDGVSFADLNSFVSRSYSDNAQVMQRIADKKLSAKRAQQAADEEAARQVAEQKAAKEAVEAEMAAEVAMREQEAAAAAKASAEPEAEKVENKNTSTAGQEANATADNAEAADTGAAAHQPHREIGSRGGRGDRGDRGDRGGRGYDRAERGNRGYDRVDRGGDRGGRGYDRSERGGWRGDRGGDRGDRRGRGDRGDRGNYRGRGRGGYNRGTQEDEDGFVVETGEKPKPRRGNNNFRGRRGDGEFRGGRGGEWNDRRGGDRGGRGGRPETTDGGAPQVDAAQASAAVQSEM